MPLDAAFVEDCPYSPEALLLEEILEIDLVKGRVVARMPVHAELPITIHQKVHSVRHPRHMSGGLMVHMTGMMGFVHAYYVLGLRHHVLDTRTGSVSTDTPTLWSGPATIHVGSPMISIDPHRASSSW